ncbi:MAG: ABC transporter substrate-binding protein [Patescibacteria group bacterium]|jgi:branched-chain amino acid transport system substrate-binding protein
MSKSIKWVIGIVAVVVVVAIGYFVSRGPKEVSEVPIKIGMVAPMTGDLAFMGEGIRDAILLAKENMSSTKYTYEVIFEDDQLDPKMTASAVNKLISVDKADVIISFSSVTGNVITPIAEQNEVVHFGIASDPNVAIGKFNFIHWTPPSEENKVFIEELQRRGIKKLGVFESNAQGAAAVMADLQERLKGTDIEIVTDQVFNFGEKDFRSIIAKAKNSEAEIYLLMAFSPELEILAKQMKEAGINTPLTSIESFELSEQVALFEGDWYVNAADPTGDFADKFKTKTGKNPTLGAANGYDIFNLVVAATEKIISSTKPTPDQIVSELMNIKDFSGALGNLSIDEDGLVVSKAAIRMIKDGQPVSVSE